MGKAFPFPSNGNAERKGTGENAWQWPVGVSIPFKRESGDKEQLWSWRMVSTIRFHSLQTGARIARTAMSGLLYGDMRFPFPSNGSAHRKYRTRNYVDRDKIRVSIPFKRESVSKGIWKSSDQSWRRCCFHSLQTGKPIQRGYGSLWTPHTI